MLDESLKPKAKIIYLDFDGVLHPTGIRRHHITGEVSCDDGKPLFRWLPTLERLLDGHQVEIILSTSWVFAFGFEQTMSYLPESITSRIIGATWQDTDDVARKYEYVRQYRCDQILVDAKKRGLVNSDWLAIDDDIETVSQHMREQFAPCDPTKGLSDSAVQAVISNWLRHKLVSN